MKNNFLLQSYVEKQEIILLVGKVNLKKDSN